MNVLVGANGAGKSNLISFFQLLNWMTPSSGNLQTRISTMGGANAILHDGAETTPQIQAGLTFKTEQGTNEYEMRLFHAAQDTLIFAEERYRFSSNQFATVANWKDLGSGHRESKLPEIAATEDKTAQAILRLLKKCVVYQFHNTSDKARMKQKWPKEDSPVLEGGRS